MCYQTNKKVRKNIQMLKTEYNLESRKLSKHKIAGYLRATIN